MALDPSALNDKLMKEYEKFVQNGGGQAAYLASMAKALDEAFQSATLSMQNVSLKEAKGTLVIPPGEGPVMATNIATAISNYFALTIAPTGVPTVGPISVVVNTAATIIAPLTAAIMGLTGKDTSVEYNEFAKVVCDNVKTITWTVTEMIPGTPPVPQVFTVTIS